MALKIVVDTLEGLDDATKALYEQKPNAEGKFDLIVEGIDGLRSALGSEREAAKKERIRAEKAEALSKAFSELGMAPETIKELKSKMEGDAEAQLLAAGKINELLGLRTTKMREDFQKKLEAADETVKKALDTASKWTGKVLENHIREAALVVGVHKNAVQDALLRARGIFQLNEDGNAVAMRDGSPVLGKDGKTPLSPSEWLDSMKEVAPHWFPAPGSGTGSQQSSNATNAKSIKRAAFEALGPAERRKAVVEDGMTIVD